MIDSNKGKIKRENTVDDIKKRNQNNEIYDLIAQKSQECGILYSTKSNFNLLVQINRVIHNRCKCIISLNMSNNPKISYQ